jgi:Tfp pilus assembly protein PilF
MQAGHSRSAELFALVRGNPVLLFGGLAVLIGIGFGIYVYLQVAHPGIFLRQAATRPQEQSPPAPPSPGSIPPAPPGVPGANATAAGGAGVAPPFDPVLSAAPASGGSDSGRIGGAPTPPAGPPFESSPLPVAASSVLGRNSAAEVPRAPVSERAMEPRQERGNIRATEPERDAPASMTRPAAAPPAPEPTPAPAARPAPIAARPAEPARERIAVSATAAQPRLNPALREAYANLQSGDTDRARALYGKVAQDEPLNIDALLGLAYIAAQENRSEDATRLYVNILQLNPRHAIAQAALIGLMGRADPAASESRLKQLIAREPSPFLHFILGNLYADQGLWSQAQQSYFQAHTLEPGNPDYAYNLAVGLDHLRQQKLALDFYRRAEQLAASQGRANFNLAHARERIRTLSSQGQ